MKRYFQLWRFGWVAFVAVFLGTVGARILSIVVKAITGTMGPDNLTARISVAVAFFLVAALPYFGWILEMAAGHLERFNLKQANAAQPDAAGGKDHP